MSARGVVLAISVLAVLAALAGTVDPAHGCSCALGDPRTALRESDAAFVGTLLERREGPIRSSADVVTLVFRVERSVKGQLGSRIEVRTAASGASCGIEAHLGQRTGLFLTRIGSQWSSTLCRQIAPRTLLAAAAPLPRALGGHAALVVTGRFGSARTLALDARGRTLAYGLGRGEGMLLSECPGSRRVAEVAADRGGVLLGVRRVRTFRLAWERRLSPSSHGVEALQCRDSRGTDIFAFLRRSDGFARGARLVRVRPSGETTLWRGSALSAGFSGAHAYISAGGDGSRLIRIDVRSGRAAPLGRVPPYSGSFVPSPNGQRLAGVAYSAPIGRDAPASRVVLVDLEPRFRVRSAPLSRPNVTGEVLWLASDRVVFLPDADGDVDDVRVYDSSLGLWRRWRGWRARGAVLLGQRAFGIGLQGELVAATAALGPARVVHILPSPAANALVALRSSSRVDAVQPPD
jgi:hypothetical protein